MPSLTDIANQVANTLNQIQTNTASTDSTTGLIKGDTADIKSGINALNTITQTDLTNLSNGLAVMIQQEKVADNLLDFNRQQNDTIICWLSKIATLLCSMLQRLDRQIEIQEEAEDSVEQIKDTLELVYGTETVEVLKNRELRERIEKCCPKPHPEEKPCFEPCEEPGFKPYTPDPATFTPLPQRQTTK